MSQNSAPKEGIMKKIKALMDKANSTDSLAEKEAFMLGAQRLLADYNIEVSEVIRIGESGSVKEDAISYSEMWEKKLMHYICLNNFCRSISDKSYINIIGKPGNIEVCIYLFKFFSSALATESMHHYNRYCAEEIKKFLSKKKNKGKFEDVDKFLEGSKVDFVQDFMIGGCEGILNKMLSQKKAQMDSNTNFTALVRVNDDEVDAYVKKHYPYLTSSRGQRTNNNSSGYAAGYIVGSGINQHKAVGTKQRIS
jgi:hypothetical protein